MQPGGLVHSKHRGRGRLAAFAVGSAFAPFAAAVPSAASAAVATVTTIEATAARATAATALAGRPVLFRAGDIHREITPLKFLVVKQLHGLVGLIRAAHLDESKPARLAGELIENDIS